MKSLIIKIHNQLNNVPCLEASLKNEEITTYIFNYYTKCNKNLTELSKAFNTIFGNYSKHNKINAFILQDEILFKTLDLYINNEELFETYAIKSFNEATKTSSIAKCSKDQNYYIMKCYDYFFYIFDKKNKECIMVVNDNKKALTMINILLLTPYLMCGELNAIHGGLVSKNNQNILINNSSLGGKTTFAILFAQDDWDIITEENTYVSKNGEILPYNIRNYFNIRAGTYLAFEEYFCNKGIINQLFLSMKGKSHDELFDCGKDSQLSINFEEIGKNFKFNNQKITHSLKVSILKGTGVTITRESNQDLVDSFINLSASPTVQLFEELLDNKSIDPIKRKNNLSLVFANVNSFTIKTGLDYKENFEHMKNYIGVK